MARTVTIRLSVVVGVVLLIAGGGLYGLGAYDKATYDRDAGIDVAPTSEANVTATNFSDLPREQQALFLLAVEPGQDSYYTTTDEDLQELSSEMPAHVRYNTTIYDISNTHTDAVVGMFKTPIGILLAAIGSVTLLSAGATSILRRIRDWSKDSIPTVVIPIVNHDLVGSGNYSVLLRRLTASQIGQYRQSTSRSRRRI